MRRVYSHEVGIGARGVMVQAVLSYSDGEVIVARHGVRRYDAYLGAEE